VAIGDVQVTFVGNLTADPELRFTPSGVAVANFTVACTPRTLDKNTNEWKDGETTYLRCQVWRTYAENVAESLSRGTRVMVSGKLRPRTYETKEGEKRVSLDVDVDEIGPVLRTATAKVARNSSGQPARSSEDSDTSWETGTNAWGSAPISDEPPF
jgi:single-strand DNA-binding protein